MARSHKIYLVYEDGEDPDWNVIAAFTVKHEAITFCEKNLGDRAWRICSTTDGKWCELTEVWTSSDSKDLEDDL